MTTNDLMLSRRQALGLGAAALASLGLVACDSEEAPTGTPTGEDASEEVQLDAAAYDELVASGPVADDETIAASTWATAVRDAGVLRVGGVQTSMLFSLLNEEDGHTRGFDAGLSQLLTRYILGDESKQELTQVTSDTRESVLQNDQVDTVFATYSINDDRKQVISFAGPYYTTQQSILVMADNTDINSVDDLAGRNVAAQSGSTGPSILEEYAPEANVQEFSTDEEARTALSQGRVDAYVIDTTMQMGSMTRNPGRFRLAGDPFGPVDAYGIGLPLDSDGVDFVNAWLQQIEDEGLWADLWQVCIGDRAGIDDVPEPPAIGA
ncbi:MAG TPA: glutamate ABC transporter substrate-binding protein [Candidatus Olsenella pullistercoris]|uniref:Glutamate ABC transporter substrate-binding protein n=1 Tax=Candidatus Olsenella pullistercoris TaxID=2838712 RepID=A0A9D2EZ65_9ACTN|nr:glutamate ABC transporter substrate-binding protein [Candidatus Olsenella pullistercoris]